MEGMDAIWEKRSTLLLDAVVNTVSAEGCGLLWQLLKALHPPPTIETK